MISFVLVALLAAPPASDAEVKVVTYLKGNVKPGQPVVVSELVNAVFTSPEDRAALSHLFDTFFKIPLFLAQHQTSKGKPPTLAEIAEQFRFGVPGQADVMLRIMESDPRMPRFITRDPATGEITRVDVEAILAHPKFGKLLERTLAGWKGTPAPPFRTTTYDGKPLDSDALRGHPHLVYFWFTNCPPCVRTSPLLAKLHRTYASKGFEIVAMNADRVLELPYTDLERNDYAKRTGMAFTLAHMTKDAQEAYGAVSVFPTFFFVDRKGVVVEHLMGAQEEAALEAAIGQALK